MVKNEGGKTNCKVRDLSNQALDKNAEKVRQKMKNKS
jgi:hypothetical protein